MMRTSVIVSMLFASTLVGEAQLLAPSAKKSATDALMTLLRTSKMRENATIDTARKALDAAVKSDRDALKLYMECIKKVDWDDKKKSTMEWQKWRDSEANQAKFSDKGFARAVRFSMVWAQLSLNAQQLGEYRNQSQVDQIFSLLEEVLKDKIVLLNNKDILTTDMLQESFGKAYGVSQLRPENWPNSVLDIEGIFERLVFKSLRTEKNHSGLRKAWDRRIMLEIEMAKKDQASEDDKDRKERGVSGLKKPPVLKDDTKKALSNIEWNKEVDCFQAGDEAQAMKRLFGMVKETIDPKLQSNRIKECLQLMKIDPKTGASTASPSAPSTASQTGRTSPSAVPAGTTPSAPESLFDEEEEASTTFIEETSTPATGTTIKAPPTHAKPATPTARPTTIKPAGPVKPKLTQGRPTPPPAARPASPAKMPEPSPDDSPASGDNIFED